MRGCGLGQCITTSLAPCLWHEALAPAGLLHLAPQMLGREVGVAQGELDVLVAENLLERLEATASHDEPGREVMPAVVEVEVIELGLFHRVLERRADTLVGPDATTKLGHLTARAGLERSDRGGPERRQDIVDGLPHGHLAAPA